MIADFSQVKETLFQSRSMRQIGVALVGLSVVLALFVAVPLATKVEPEANVAAVEALPETPRPDAYANVPLLASAAIVYDLATGEALYEKNADAQLPLASLTKLLAVYAALDRLPEDTLITVSPTATLVDYPRGFSPGETLSLKELSRLTLTASLNDGAAALVEATARATERSQDDVLSQAVSALQLTQTYALNGSGLDMNDTISGAYGSARVMARLAGALAARAPGIVSATTQLEVEGQSRGGVVHTVRNTARVVDQVPQLLLSKTGFTDLAGGNWALVMDVGLNHPVAIVVLGSTKEARFTDGMTLVAATFAHFAGVESL